MAKEEYFRVNIEIVLILGKMDVHSLEDLIKTLKNRFSKNVLFISVIENKSEYVLDILFQNDVDIILFDFNPELLLEEIRTIYDNKNIKSNQQEYIINFYENKDIFFIDITGTLKKEKISQLKLIFMHYLKDKITKLKGIVYIFNNTDEYSMNFPHIWLLFRFWKDLRVPYNKIYYLTTSHIIIKNIQYYLGDFGIMHCSNLLDIVKILFPDLKNKNEMEIFEFATSLLTTSYKNRPIQ